MEDGEIKNSVLVWSTIVAALCYCHTVGKIFPSDTPSRRLSIFPVICLFFVLPLKLTSIHLGAVTCFFIAWLATFKLILFSFNTGPLYSNPPLPLSRFIPLACFPIKLQKSHLQPNPPRINLATKFLVLALLVRLYAYKHRLHPKFIWFCYCIHIYLALEMLLAFFGAVAKAVTRVELEPQFDEPYLTTSLQDFWGRRWNLMVTKTLHPTVFLPVRSASARFLERRWAAIPAVVATFLVSGLMHELIVYDFGRVRPSGEMLGFFVLHGVSMSVEMVVKKLLPKRFWLPGIVSGPMTVAYVIWSSFWLFFPPFLRAGADLKGCTESLAFIEFVKTRRLVSPTQLTCPFL